MSSGDRHACHPFAFQIWERVLGLPGPYRYNLRTSELLPQGNHMALGSTLVSYFQASGPRDLITLCLSSLICKMGNMSCPVGL